MRTPRQRTRGSRSKAWIYLALVAAFAWLLLFASKASAANYTWSGSSTTSHRWSEAANWSGTAPSGTVGTLEFPELIAPACTADPVTAACYDSENDVSGLEVNALMLDNAAPYNIDGEAITLGAGGLTASTTSTGFNGNTALGTPIVLGASQTWRLDGNDNDSNNVIAEQVSGDSAHTLGISLSHHANLDFGGNVGPVTITGENAANVGSTAGANGAIALSGSSLNGTDGEAVSITDAGLDANGPGVSVGPLTTNGAFVSVGGLVGGGDLTVDGGVTLDSASVLQLSINGSGSAYSQLRASGAINLANAQLALEGVKAGLVQGECPTLTAGQVDTLITTTTGSLAGTFAGVPNGGTVKLSDCTGTVPTMEIHYTAHTVTATVVAPSFTWSGAGAPGSDWSSSANWGGSAPSGEVGTLTFPLLTSAACTANPATGTCYESANDLAGLEANALSISAGYSITGSAFTLGGGGITTNAAASPPFGSAIDTPVTLTAPQSWTIDGGEYAGLTVSNKVTGPSDALGIDLGHGSLEVIDDVEAGTVTVTGAYRLTLWGPGSETAKLNATDDSHVNFSAGTELVADNGAIGPLTLTGAGLYLSNLGNVNSAGGLSVAGGVTLGNTFTTEIVKSGNVAGTDYGQLTATGPINLDSAQLTLFTSAITGMGFRCLALTPGKVYTLATTAGALSGTFDGVPDGATVSGNCGLGAGTPPTFKFNYTANAVTATVLTGGSDETEEESAARKKGEEEVAAKKSEEEAAAAKKAEEGAAAGKTGGGTNPGGGSTTGGGSSSSDSTTGSGTSTAGSGKSPVVSVKPLTQAQKLAKALRSCKKEKPKSKRKACEAQAKKRYKPKPKKKVKNR